MIREVNEDSFLVLTQPALAPGLTALLVVADGMGGHQAGDVASGEVIRSLNELFSSPTYQEQVGYSQERDDYYVVVLKEVLEQINEHLFNLQASQPELHTMGTTGSVILLVDSYLYIGHVGDSRIYRLQGASLQQLTQDHSWVAEQVAAGALTPQEAAAHPKRNQLTRCLGNSPVLRVDRTAHRARLGDVLLLCSDGLTGVVGDGEIAQVLASTSIPQRACDYLVELANQRGGPDNITVVVARIVEGKGSDLPGGRAFGPHRQVAPTQQVDTVKILRPKAQPGRQPRTPRSQRTRKGRDLIRPIMVAFLSALASFGCAILTAAMLTWLPSSVPQILEPASWEDPIAITAVSAVSFVSALFGVGTGLVLSGWMRRAASVRAQPAGQQEPNRDTSQAQGQSK